MGIWSDIRDTWQRIFAPPRAPYGAAGSSGEIPVYPTYDLEHAMSALGAFPAVSACVRARAGDLGGLPLIYVRRQGETETIEYDHPALSVLRRSGLRFRHQSYADFSLADNAMHERVGILELGGRLERMHPALARQVITAGRLTGWTYGIDRQLPASDIIHVAGISWSAGDDMWYGEPRIRSLEKVLTTVAEAQGTMRRQAARGRPEVLITSQQGFPGLSPEAVRRVTSAWEAFTRAKHGAFVVGEGLKADLLNLTPRDMEFAKAEERAIAMVLMVMECPPARVFWGGGSAYGTDRQAMRTYWEALLLGMGAAFADAWSLALLGEASVTDGAHIEHDASRVEALAVNRTEALTRAEKWVNVFGMTTENAARYEGFRGAPVGEATGKSTRPIDRQPEEPQDDRQRAVTAVAAYLVGAARRYEARVARADGDASRVDAASEESIRLLAVVESLGVSADTALAVAADSASVTDEAVIGMASEAWARGVRRIGLQHLDLFSSRRAEHIVSSCAPLVPVVG